MRKIVSALEEKKSPLSGGKRFLLIPFDQGLPPNPPQLTAEIVCNCENQSIRTLSILFRFLCEIGKIEKI